MDCGRACREISAQHINAHVTSMEGYGWPGEERSPLQYELDWRTGGYYGAATQDGYVHAVPMARATSGVYPYGIGTAYAQTAAGGYPRPGPAKRRSDAVFVEPPGGKRVCMVSNGRLQVSDRTLHRVMKPNTDGPMPSDAVTCSCGERNRCPPAPFPMNAMMVGQVQSVGHVQRPMPNPVADSMLSYPQIKMLSTCRVPTASSDAPRGQRFFNFDWPSKDSVIVYLNNDQEIVDVHGWRYVDTLGEGSYGKVYFVRNEFTGEESAFKRMLLHKTGGISPAIMREIHSLKSLDHANVIKLNRVYIGDCRVYLSFPRIDGGNLRQFLEKHYPQGMPLNEVRVIAKQLINAVAHIHSKCIIHRDIKPENILVQTEEVPESCVPDVMYPKEGTRTGPEIIGGNNGGATDLPCNGVRDAKPTIKRVMITDFGLSRIHKSVDVPLFYGDDTKMMNSPMSPEVVTLCYRPPELLLGDFHYSFSVDMWSLGCVIFELLTGKPIFEERTEFALLIAMFKRFGTPNEEDWPNVATLPFMNPVLPDMKKTTSLVECVGKADAQCMDLLERLFALSPKKRIAAQEALRHPWIAKS
ncbi:cyclin-dependent kinase 2-like protein [Babesia caballi]|uniref:Cyclin-dependent kinase 2 homolog n=1 Tax=Babesia caballi TaxID=5871 RepID=A0AAV4LQV1_BABCB|nr:cyclin-dependent kinase 2-like protein [Babesia caballi]